MKLGVRLETLGVPFRRALQLAQRLSVEGVEFDAAGDLAPSRLSETGRRQLRHLFQSHGLEVTAIGCPLRRGLDSPDNLDARIDYIRQVLSLSFDLGAFRVIIEAGRIPDDSEEAAATPLLESLSALASHGDRTGTVLALTTGLESLSTLATVLNRFDTAGLAVNYSPGNLLLNGFDPFADLALLKGRIVHVQARDARRSGTSRASQEVPLGHGDIDWLHALGLLSALEYRGWLVIDRNDTTGGSDEIAAGVAFLRRLL